MLKPDFTRYKLGKASKMDLTVAQSLEYFATVFGSLNNIQFF